MTMEEQKRLPLTHIAALGGLAAITVALIINVGVGKLHIAKPTYGAELVAPALAARSPISTEPLATINVDSNAGQPADKVVEAKPKVMLSRDQVWEVQAWLKAFKLDPGPIDGIAGPRTYAAVKQFEAAHQRPETGNLDYGLLGALRTESGQPLR
jgi:peptidoglycan hydrolase-like protein with peptidoglycan-binding domain